MTTNIDIALREDLQEALKQPACLDVSLPKPSNVSVTLPNGGRIKGIADITKGIPSDCSLSFSLMMQMGPIMANMECLIKILKLVKPLTDVINGLPFPPAKAIVEFGEAAKPAIECVVSMVGGGIPLFVRDLLCLTIKLLNCMIGQMKSLLALLGRLQLRIDAAEAEGNTELLEALDCARENAVCSGQAAMQAFEPVTLILELAAPLLEIAGQPAIEIPSAAPVEDIETAEQAVATLEEFVQTLQLVADALGGCE
ncbi:MAG: hypothetical protein WD397_17285 [Wenzhouxiangellaceae bacterium]